MIILSTIKKFDFYGPSVQFTIRTESNFKTILGGILSLFTIILYFFSFYFFSLEFFLKENANIITQSVPIKDMENYQQVLNQENFFVSFGYQYSIGYYGIRKQDLLIDANFLECNNYLSEKERCKKKKLSFGKCGNLSIDYNYLREVKETYDNFNDEFLCLHIPKNETIILKSDRESPFKYNYLEIKVSFNQTNKTCSNKMMNIWKNNNQTINLFSLASASFNPKNVSHPFNHRGVRPSNYQFGKIVSDEFYIEYNSLYNDNGMIFNNQIKSERYSYSNPKTKSKNFDIDLFNKTCQNETLFDLNRDVGDFYTLSIFINTKVYYEHYRTYKKLQDVLGNVNGFVELFKIIIFIIIQFHSNYRLDFFLVNSTTKVRENFKKNPKKDNELILFNNKTSNDLNKDSYEKKKNFELLLRNNENKNTDIFSNRNLKESDNLDKKLWLINKSSSIVSITNEKKENILSTDGNLIELTNNDFIEIPEKIDHFIKPKIRYFNPSLINYYCFSSRICKSKKKQNIDAKLSSILSEKIKRKLDIIYYFKILRKVKNFQELFFLKDEQKFFFHILSKDLYNFRLNDILDEKNIFKINSICVDPLKEYYINKKSSKEQDYDIFLDEIFPSKLDKFL